MAIDTTTSVDVQTLTPFKKFIMTIGNIPTSYLESMSYAELLMWFCNYLQNTVIPTVNNNAEALEEVQRLMTELQEYVDNYFTNLDVQEEINNKLDDMVEQGILQEIIADYLNSKAIFGFDNVASMKSSTNLIDGSYAETLGYYSKNDGGKSLYKIRNITNDDVVDNMTIIALNNNNLIAELIEKTTIKVEQLGAYGDEIHDDLIPIQKAINSFKEIIFNNNYLISNTIDIISDIEIKGNTTSSIKINNDLPIFSGIDVHNVTIKDLTLYKNSGENYHIEFSGYFVTIENCTLTGLNFSTTNFINGINNITTSNTHFCNKFIHNKITNGQLIVNSTDGWIKDNIIWCSTTSVFPEAYAIKIMNNSWDVEGNQIVGGSLGGLYAKGNSNGQLLNIINNFFDGSYNNVLTGTHIVLDNNRNTTNITNNKFFNGYKNSITFINSYYVMVNNNTFFNNNRSAENIGEFEIQDYTYGNRISICNNMFQNVTNSAYDLIKQYGKNIIIFHDNIINGNYNTNYNYVTTRYINSKGNIYNGATYQRVCGAIQDIGGDRYGVIFIPEVYNVTMNIEAMQIDNVDVTGYNVTTYQNQSFIYKNHDVDNVNKIVTAIVREAV